MLLMNYIQAMPKVELHVHLEGAVRPETLLQLARRYQVALPADTVEGIQQWYAFTDFKHFVDIYLTISGCIRTADDIEMIAWEFLSGQAAQNVLYTEVTYTAYTHYMQKGLPFETQLAALNRAKRRAEAELGVTMNLIIDIPRVISAEDGVMVAEWCVSGKDDGVVALGLGGPEANNPPERYVKAFERAAAGGVPSVPHAGEMDGPASIWGALRSLGAVRIGHGVRCLEDPALVAELRQRQIPLEVCPTSNICLRAFPRIEDHPLPRLLAEGLYVTLNSDDPPMFNTTLTDEYLTAARVFGLGADDLEAMSLRAARAALVSEDHKARLEKRLRDEYAALRAQQNM